MSKNWLNYYFAMQPGNLRFFNDNGIRTNALLSFAYLGKKTLNSNFHEIVGLWKSKGSRFMLDSGAFTNFRKPGTVGMDQYVDYLSGHSKSWDEYITLDDLGSRKVTLANFDTLKSKGFNPLFVDHLKFSDEPLVEALWKNEDKICVSGYGTLAKPGDNKLPGSDNPFKKLGVRVEMAKKFHTRLHILAVSSLRKFIPFLDTVESVDSATWDRAAGYGSIIVCETMDVGGLKIPKLKLFDHDQKFSISKPMTPEAKKVWREFKSKKWSTNSYNILVRLFCVTQIIKYVDLMNQLDPKSIAAAAIREKEAGMNVKKQVELVGLPDPWDSQDVWMREGRSADPPVFSGDKVTKRDLDLMSDVNLLLVHDKVHSKWEKLPTVLKGEGLQSHFLVHDEMLKRGMNVADQDRNDTAVKCAKRILTLHKLQSIEKEDLEMLTEAVNTFHSGPGSLEIEKENPPSQEGDNDTEKELVVKLIPIDKKAPDDKQIVLGVVLEPNTVDSQGDIISEEEIEKAAHLWLARYQDRGFMHDKIVNSKVEIYESYIAPSNMTISGQSVKKGTWLLMYHILDSEMWQKIKSGEQSGFSMGGFARRVKV